MIPKCTMSYLELPFAWAHGNEFPELHDLEDPIQDQHTTRLKEILQEYIYAGKDTIIALVQDDSEFQKDPQAYLEAWDKMRGSIARTQATDDALKCLRERMNTKE